MFDSRHSFLILIVRPNIEANAETMSILICRPSFVRDKVARSSAYAESDPGAATPCDGWKKDGVASTCVSALRSISKNAVQFDGLVGSP